VEYRHWLGDNAVKYIALSDANLDFSAEQEDELVRSGRLPWLREVFRSAHWRVFAVQGNRPIADGARATHMGADSLDLLATHPGTVRLRVHFSPYWALATGDGCVENDDNWTRLRLRRAGQVRLVTRFSLVRIVSRGPRCSS
jgi:hypothetical protein